MTNILEKLKNWEMVYPEDYDKPDGNLYVEAADEIARLRKREQELESLLREAREDLAARAGSDYPKGLRDIQPAAARGYEREMELPLRIDALIDKEKKDD